LETTPHILAYKLKSFVVTPKFDVP